MLRLFFSLLAIAALLVGCAEEVPPPVAEKPIAKIPLKVGAKQFPEQAILANMLVELLNGTGDYEATVIGPFPNTKLIHEALVDGRVDLYIEYSGTANKAILGLQPLLDPKMDDERLRKFYEEKFQADWLLPLGFENTYVFAVDANGALATLDDFSGLASQAIGLSAGMDTEFISRLDGYPLLQDKYGMVFHDVEPIGGAAAYTALETGKLDAIVANSTDGELTRDAFRMINDHLEVLPRYEAVPVVRMDAEARAPGLQELLLHLSEKIGVDTMRKLNADVVLSGRLPADVAREFVETNREYLLTPAKLPARPPLVDLAPADSFPATPAPVEPGAAPPIAPAEAP